MTQSPKKLEILVRVFKHHEFRGDQEQIIDHAMSGGDSLVLMPTGMGKSLCYQFPAVAAEGLVLVISPLIALMQDQVTRARALGIRAAAINSSLSAQEKAERLEKLKQNRWQLLYVTPERFKKPEFLEALEEFRKHDQIQLLAVDEAHCISQWGHDFRPDYSRLGEFRKLLGSPPVMALTATATPKVQADILAQLQMGQGTPTYSAGIERKNLSLSVHEVYGFDEKIRSLVALRHQSPGPAIFYFSLIQSLQKASGELERLGLQHLVYHGNLPSAVRSQNQNLFLQSESPLILATPAFGLGVDKANVRLLVHAEFPNSVESYFQEVGRAGRDGKPSSCHLLLDQDDVSIQMDFIKWANPDLAFTKTVYNLIKSNPLRLAQQGFDFLREQMNFYNKRDYRVETAVNQLERWGALVQNQKALPQDRFPYVAGAFPSEGSEDLPTELQISQRVKTQNEKLLEMLRLAQLTEGCRMQFIFAYFGVTGKACGCCDLCKKGVIA